MKTIKLSDEYQVHCYNDDEVDVKLDVESNHFFLNVIELATIEKFLVDAHNSLPWLSNFQKEEKLIYAGKLESVSEEIVNRVAGEYGHFYSSLVIGGYSWIIIERI